MPRSTANDAVAGHHLSTLLDCLDAAAGLQPGDGSVLLRVRAIPDDDAIELGVLPLPHGQHPVDALAGFVAPDDWQLVGVLATGTARDLDDPESTTAVCSGHLIDRSGRWASRLAPFDDGPLEPASIHGEAGDPDCPVGRIDDACRRVLGIPTPPPSSGTALLWATLWLDAIVAAGGTASGRRRLGRWTEVVSRHPAIAVLVPDADLTSVDLVAKANQLAEWRDWQQLRRTCAAGLWRAPRLDAGVVGWLDDGAFSRWLLGELPDLTDLRATVAELLPPRVVQRVDAVLTACGVGGERHLTRH